MSHSLARAEERLLHDDPAGAEHELRTILAGAPDEAVAHNLMGLVHVARHELADAMTEFSTAAGLRDPYDDALVNLALCCNRTGKHDLALDACRRVPAGSHTHVFARVNEARAWRGLDQPDAARRALADAGAHPLAHVVSGEMLLFEGDIEQGLQRLEERHALARPGAGPGGVPWTGEPRPRDRLLVIPEQGLGEMLFMSRFLPALADRFAHVVVLAPAPLSRLLATLDERVEIVTSLDRARWDVWAPVGSVPWLLGAHSLEDVPREPWIRVAGNRDAAAALRVGINWAGDPTHPLDALRSTSLDAFAPLLESPGIDWVSLRVGAREAEAAAYGIARPLEGSADFLDTARVVAELDLVVATDSAVAHLAAAMGVPTCVLTTADADWRWQGWYRDVTLCPQQAPGNWHGSIARVAGALIALLDSAQEARAAA